MTNETSDRARVDSAPAFTRRNLLMKTSVAVASLAAATIPSPSIAAAETQRVREPLAIEKLWVERNAAVREFGAAKRLADRL